MSPKTVSIPVPTSIADQLPADPGERERVVELGVREWRIREALAAFERGEGSLAFAARRAGIPLREMIPLAYAHGLEPRLVADAGPLIALRRTPCISNRLSGPGI